MAPSYDDVRRRYEEAGQGHVFEFYDELSDDEKSKFLEQLDAVKVEELAGILEAARKGGTAENGGEGDDDGGKLDVVEPFKGPIGRAPIAAAVGAESGDSVAAARAVGLEAVRHGQVAAVVLAGGQGTRLGYDGPKGMYDISLPSGRTLFQLVAERIGKLSDLAAAGGDATSKAGDDGGGHDDKRRRLGTTGCTIPLYVMTSPLNHEATAAYFQDNEYFGLGESNVTLFQQGTLPCLTEDGGKLILEGPGKLAMAPDGNGGIYPSLKASGALDDMSRRGVKYLHAFSIDNALVRPADPAFVGYCVTNKADCGNKVVWKAHPHEKVGVIASRGGKPCIVEYSEITKKMAELEEEGEAGSSSLSSSSLVYGAANICNHFYTLEFIRDTVLPNFGSCYHVARKKIPYYDKESKATVTPASNNGIKLETFIFDVFSLSERMAVLEARREEEFAPVKNAPGSTAGDSPDTARELISELGKRWVRDAGGNLEGDGGKGVICEVAPSTSYAGEGLEGLVQGKVIACPFSL